MDKGKQRSAEEKAYALACKVLGTGSSSLSRKGAKAITRQYTAGHEQMMTRLLCEMIDKMTPSLPDGAREEIKRRIEAYRPPASTKTGPRLGDLGFRHHLVCCVIHAIVDPPDRNPQEEPAIDATRRQNGAKSACAIVADVLAELRAESLSEESVRDLWQKRDPAWTREHAIAWLNFGPLSGRN